MFYSTVKFLVIAFFFVVLLKGCPKAKPELRVLTPEQEQKLLERAERIEDKEVVRRPLKNDKGEVIGVVSSQTRIVYLRGGGGRFDLNTSCSSTCNAPTSLAGTCEISGCDVRGSRCTALNCGAGPCTPNCTKLSTGFGNFGVLIAMYGDDPSNTRDTGR